MSLEIIHVGNVCQPCAEDWRQVYRRHYRPNPVVVTCYETTPGDCDDCEGDHAFNKMWDVGEMDADNQN